jgi:hypothetical protein
MQFRHQETLQAILFSSHHCFIWQRFLKDVPVEAMPSGAVVKRELPNRIIWPLWWFHVVPFTLEIKHITNELCPKSKEIASGYLT